MKEQGKQKINMLKVLHIKIIYWLYYRKNQEDNFD